MSQKEGEEAARESFKVSRRHITCDAPNCNKHSPAKRCSRCKMVYYCDEKCQRDGWKSHREDCQRAQEIYHKVNSGTEEEHENSEPEKTLIESNYDASSDEVNEQKECAICFEEFRDVQNVTKLVSCGHVFCFKCLADYQKRSIEPSSYEQNHTSDDDNNNEDIIPTRQQMYESMMRNRERSKGRGPGMSCPLCRSKIPDLRKSIHNKISLKISKMRRLSMDAGNRDIRKKEISEEDQQELNRLSQEILDEMQPLYDLNEERLNFQLNLSKCDLLHLKGDSVASIELYEKIFPIAVQATYDTNYIEKFLDQVSLDEPVDPDDEQNKKMMELANNNFFMSDQCLASIAIDMIEVRMFLGDWKGADKDIKCVMGQYLESDVLTTIQQRQIFMSMAQCCYELGEYEWSINGAEASIEMNRHFPGVFTYIGKSYRAKGDLENADKYFSQAVLYETPWDKKNMIRTQEQYDAFRREVSDEYKG